MSAYVVVNLNVLDKDKLAEYSQQAALIVAKFGGKFIAKGAAQSLHGDQQFANLAVIEFANEKQAHGWYQCDEYQALIGIRSQAMDCQFQLVS